MQTLSVMNALLSTSAVTPLRQCLSSTQNRGAISHGFGLGLGLNYLNYGHGFEG